MKTKKTNEPPMAFSTRSTAVHRTGAWRYANPVFLERIAPCNEACPAGEDIDTVMFLNSQGRFGEAYRKIREENPFPGICGRVCIHPCEEACNRRFFDEPVSIRGLERFVSDFALEKSHGPESPTEQKGKRIAIVGGGPAGLSCAYFLIRMGYRVTVFEKRAEPGGMLRWAIPAYRLPADILHWEMEQVLSMGIDLQTRTCVGQDVSVEDLQDFDAVFLAPGASQGGSIPGIRPETQGIHRALEFLAQACDGVFPSMKGRVAIVGGGNTAIDAARTALRLGGEPTVIYRRSREDMPADLEVVAQAEKEGVAFVFLTGVSGIVERAGQVEAVSCVAMEPGERDAAGRRVCKPSGLPPIRIAARHVILAVGQTPETGFLPVRIRASSGFILVDTSLETTWKGFFAGGDAVNQPGTVVQAIASGKKGAMAIDHSTRGGSSGRQEEVAVGGKGGLSMEAYRNHSDDSRTRSINEVVPYEALHIGHFRKSLRIRSPVLNSNEGIRGFEEVEKGYSKHQALRSAKRCFNCGVCTFCSNCYEFCPDLAVRLDHPGVFPEIDYDHCKGCGICVEECPRAVMGWTRQK